MKTLAPLGVIWGVAVALAIAWVSLKGYRDPQANRFTVWLDDAYRRLSGDPPGGGADYSRERMLQNVWICGVIALLGLVVLIKELLK